ncbi:MAG: helix-turn-helix domain-containing protein [Candidatus Methylomirabilis oxyfera]|nr:helix-turn-helix domain-containing protein [Candidatus Methylomirabilis oxyfera]
MRERERALSVGEASEMLAVSPRSLSDRRFRIRLGLQARRIGGRIVFLESDLLRLLERGREGFPGERRR